MPLSTVPEIDCSGQSHIGPVRQDNQDAIRLPDERLSDRQGWLYAVADGMGGYAHGGLASTLALETLYQTFYGGRAASASKQLRHSVELANLRVYQAAQRMNAGRMGTTLTALHVHGDTVHLAHVGDSRAYLVRDNKARCLTNDHTTVGDLVRMKMLSPDKVRNHAQRSILNKALGLALFIQPDITRIKLQAGDHLILCSDGVWSVIEDDEFAKLATQAESAHMLSDDLINLALARQTDDNVSAIAIHVEGLGPGWAARRQASSRWFYSLRNYFYGKSR